MIDDISTQGSPMTVKVEGAFKVHSISPETVFLYEKSLIDESRTNLVLRLLTLLSMISLTIFLLR